MSVYTVHPDSPEATGTDTLLETITGAFLDLADPDPADITLESVAYALAGTRRFRRQSRTSYTVAEHAVLVARKLRALSAGPLAQLAGLHHDDAEAYLGDLPSPLKQHPQLGPVWAELERAHELAIFQALGLPPVLGLMTHGGPVKDVDTWALLYEARRLLPSGGRGWRQTARWDVEEDFHGWTGSKPEGQACVEWLQLHERLMAEVAAWVG